MPKREALKQEPSASPGNVFADLGLPDAGEHLIKAGLVIRIDRTIRQRKPAGEKGSHRLSIYFFTSTVS